jgi:hypothetical protein
MEVSAELHAPAALSPGKETPVPISKRMGGVSESVWVVWRRYTLPLPGIELRIFGRPARSLVTIPVSSPRLLQL